MEIPEPMFLRACELYIEGESGYRVLTKEEASKQHDYKSGVYFTGRSGALYHSSDGNRYLKHNLTEFLEGKRDPVLVLATSSSATYRAAAQAYLEVGYVHEPSDLRTRVC